jgi:hypothetical protein
MFSTVIGAFSLDTVHYLDKTDIWRLGGWLFLNLLVKGNSSYINHVLITKSSQENLN